MKTNKLRYVSPNGVLGQNVLFTSLNFPDIELNGCVIISDCNSSMSQRRSVTSKRGFHRGLLTALFLLICIACGNISANAQIIQGERELRYKGMPGAPVLVVANLNEFDKISRYDDFGKQSKEYLCSLEDIKALSEKYPKLKEYHFVTSVYRKIGRETRFGIPVSYLGTVAEYRHGEWRNCESHLGAWSEDDTREWIYQKYSKSDPITNTYLLFRF
ncbi:MAG: hypothetical protein K2K47_03065 [Duncaniella sp.]|nr:hypothetical protein [Duncaniella sp.]